MAKFSQEKNIEIIKEMISEDGSDAEYGSRYDGGEGDVEEFVDRIDDNGINLRGYINGEETELSNVGDSKTFGKGHVRIELIFEDKGELDQEDGGFYLVRGFHLSFQNGAELLHLQQEHYVLEEGQMHFPMEDSCLREFYNLSTGSIDPSDDDSEFDFNEMLYDVDSIVGVEDDD
jgi:hypothetical protein|tara:strand:- start:859 stop:1383 length:525 start_codon:yes stop_codon:yes gene_type:complete